MTIACGDLDVPYVVEYCRAAADRIPTARHQVLSGTAHLPYLEAPETVAQLIDQAIGRSS